MQNEPSSELCVQIHALSSDGLGIGQAENKKFEVSGAIPGDFVRVEIGKKRRRTVKGFLKEVLEPSSDRIFPRCLHVPECGGCRLQQMNYTAQLKLKQKWIDQAFSVLSNRAFLQIQPILPCLDPWHYRNKMEFSFSQNKVGERFLGLMLAEGKRRVFNLTECFLTSSWFADIVEAIRTWWEESGLLAYHFASDAGSLRTLTLREAKRTQGKMVMLTVSGNPQFALKHSHIKSFVEAVKAVVPQEEHHSLSIFLRVQQIAKGHKTQFFEMHLFGPDHILEELILSDLNGTSSSLKFKISPTSFFQPNPRQAELLYSKALALASISDQSTVLDLYCGTATLAMAFASKVKQVIGIELNPHAIFDAQMNKEFNEVDNLELIQGDVGKVLKEFPFQEKLARPIDLVMVDPPRGGLDQPARQHILSLSPKQILYISCNPTTQARDILAFEEAGYTCSYVQPIDQFPHTMHVENIAVLKRRAAYER